MALTPENNEARPTGMVSDSHPAAPEHKGTSAVPSSTVAPAAAVHRPRAPKPRLDGSPAPSRSIGAAPEKVANPDKKQAARGAQFIALVFAAYVAFLFFSGQIEEFVSAFQNVDARWLFGAFVCAALYFIFGVGAYVVSAMLDPGCPIGVRDLMAVESSGVFFGNLTPMQMGALPSQIYELTKAGLSVGEASAVQFSRFIMFQVGVVVFAAVMLLAKFEFFLESYGDIVFINLLVFAGHALELAGLFVVCLCPGFVRRVGNALLARASRRGWVKNHDKWHDMLNNQVDEFSQAFKRSATHLSDMVVTLVVTLFQLASLYIMPWFVLHAFGESVDPLTCLAAGSMVQLVSTIVPLPGGTGGAEGGFALFLGPWFGSAATAGFLIWRIFTFFGPTAFAVTMLGLHSSHTKGSLYHRWHRFVAKASGGRFGTAAAARGSAAARPRRQGVVTVHPSKKAVTVRPAKSGVRVRIKPKGPQS